MEEKQIETELIRETGAISLERNKQHHRIELLTIIGEIEGHDVLSGIQKQQNMNILFRSWHRLKIPVRQMVCSLF